MRARDASPDGSYRPPGKSGTLVCTMGTSDHPGVQILLRGPGHATCRSLPQEGAEGAVFPSLGYADSWPA